MDENSPAAQTLYRTYMAISERERERHRLVERGYVLNVYHRSRDLGNGLAH